MSDPYIHNPYDILKAQQRIIDKIALGDSMEECLDAICREIEAILSQQNAKASILLFDKKTFPLFFKIFCSSAWLV